MESRVQELSRGLATVATNAYHAGVERGVWMHVSNRRRADTFGPGALLALTPAEARSIAADLLAAADEADRPLKLTTSKPGYIGSWPR